MTLLGHVVWNMAVTALAGTLAGGEPPPAARTKRELYGDPALVPTRAGERAREELALAGAVSAGLVALGVEVRHVEVRVPRAEDPGVLVVITGELPPGLDEEALRPLVNDLCGPWSSAVTRLHVQSASPPPPRESGGSVPLYCALVGLGASLGVALDRVWRRR